MSLSDTVVGAALHNGVGRQWEAGGQWTGKRDYNQLLEDMTEETELNRHTITKTTGELWVFEVRGEVGGQTIYTI